MNLIKGDVKLECLAFVGFFGMPAVGFNLLATLGVRSISQLRPSYLHGGIAAISSAASFYFATQTKPSNWSKTAQGRYLIALPLIGGATLPFFFAPLTKSKISIINWAASLILTCFSATFSVHFCHKLVSRKPESPTTNPD